jgi:EAL domain-containing protein (putative c-di-GMP-specific phosphodiesterase class I)/CheY-like chemotaxis protein
MSGTPSDPIPDGAAPARGRVLLVAEERAAIAPYARALQGAGFTVDTCDDGRHAVALAREHDYDVIVSDIGLPGLDGVQLLRKVREHDLDLPVVLMTGNPGIETAIQAVEFGAMRYLTKPVDVAALLEIVGYATRLRGLARLKRQALKLLGGRETRAGDRAGLEVSFNRAVKSIWLAFQPIVSWSHRTVFGYEALLRTDEPTLPDPLALFDAAARLDRLGELGRLVRDHTAETAAGPGLGDAHLFVNLHPHDLVEESLYARDSPLSRIADRVVLEITERSSLEDVRDVRARVARLRELGFRIAIDDLGAGYAGLTSFAQLHPEAVKIDMSLIRHVHREPTKQKLVRSVTALCGEMQMQVIAEGVETAEERDRLVALGCDLLQGYLFARPGPAFPTVAW